jgi:Fe-S cluster biogenesis protein NfuA
MPSAAQSTTTATALTDRIEALMQQLATIPDPTAQNAAEELVSALLELYGQGLAHMLTLIANSDAASSALIDVLAQDELVGALLLLHGLHPLSLEERIAQILAELQPQLQAYGLTIELLQIKENKAHLRLHGQSSDCSASIETLQSQIEEILYQAIPDLAELYLERELPRITMPITFIPRQQLKKVKQADPGIL